MRSEPEVNTSRESGQGSEGDAPRDTGGQGGRPPVARERQRSSSAGRATSEREHDGVDTTGSTGRNGCESSQSTRVRGATCESRAASGEAFRPVSRLPLN